MTENPPPPPGSPDGGTPPPAPPNPYGTQPSTPPPPPQNPYASAPPPPAEPSAGNPPTAGQSPYGSAPPPAAPGGQTPYGATPYPVAPDGPAPITGPQPAGLGVRFVARLVDFIILGIVTAILRAALGDVAGYGIGGLLTLGYFTYMESSQGRTLGKQILKLRVYGASGGKPTMEEALRRNAWVGLTIFSGIVFLNIVTGLAQLIAMVAIAVTISQDAMKRGWHDKFGNTSVVKEG